MSHCVCKLSCRRSSFTNSLGVSERLMGVPTVGRTIKGLHFFKPLITAASTPPPILRDWCGDAKSQQCYPKWSVFMAAKCKSTQVRMVRISDRMI